MIFSKLRGQIGEDSRKWRLIMDPSRADSMMIPTEDDWRSEEWSLDTQSAYENFHGKTIDDAVRLFEEAAMFRWANAMYMPSRVFGYYLMAYITYLMSEAALGDPDGASCFISLIEYRASQKREDIIQHWPEIEPALKRLVERQADFGAEWVIYGSFRARVNEIVQLGFTTTFDTEAPEMVPEGVTMAEMAIGCLRPVPLAVAVQVFRNSGVDSIDGTAVRPDIIRIFGPPDASGGGDHPKFGHVPDWIRYDRTNYVIRFAFSGESIANVMFLGRTGSTALSHPRLDSLPNAGSIHSICALFGFDVKRDVRVLDTSTVEHPADGRVADKLMTRAKALAAWDAFFHASSSSDRADEDIGPREDRPRGTAQQ